MAKSFDEMVVDRPDFTKISQAFDGFFGSLDTEPVATVRAWDALRRKLSAYRSLSSVKFAQNTADSDAQAEQEFADELFPRVAELETRMKQALLDRRAALEPELGAHVFELWTSDVATFVPALQPMLVEESKIKNHYNAMIASAEIDFEGEQLTLAQLGKHQSSADRAKREAATRAMWQWFEDHADESDGDYDQLVALRTKMARELGHATYTPLGYLEMQRVDYTAQDVDSFRAEVREHVVPLAAALRARQADRLGVDKLYVWDEPVHDPQGTPKPLGTPEDQVAAAAEMFNRMNPELGEFFGMMRQRGLMDLVARKGKSAGGFCTTLEEGTPFIFANFNGTHGDIDTFTHEMGHAFQCWLSRDKFPKDLVWPTLESCEIHSMSLEFFCGPEMELFFGDDADRYRDLHLTENLLFIPYGVAVDHFQHLVYDNPDASIEDRRAMWQEMEATYLPWRDWGGIAHGEAGGRWHRQAHIFARPFYYIDYVLALTAALQFWGRMQDDPATALADYVTLCRRGGEAAFQDLVKSAKLQSPFEPGALVSAVATAQKALDI